MLAALMSLALIAAAPVQDPPAQDPPAPVSQDPPETRVDDIVVDGRPLRVVAEEFVAEVGESPSGRGLATWQESLCVGVVNLRPDAAQPLIDHISAVAEDLGVRSGDPGCRPNVVVIFTEDPRGVAAAVVQADPRGFRLGARNFHLSSNDLDDFRQSDAPVRWWHTSIPTDVDTGQRAVRLPGDARIIDDGPPAPIINRLAASRLNSEIRDDLARVFVVVDATRVADVSPQQLADYLAFVALAQIDPGGDTSRQPSVLNAFRDPSSSPGLSDWDLAYLRALYRPGGPSRTDRRTISTAIASDIARTLGAQREAQ